MEFKKFLEEECYYSTKGESNFDVTLRYLEELVKDENIELEYSFEESAKAYAKAMKIEYNEEAKIVFMSHLINIGLTRHILHNLQGLKYYGYEKELEEVKKGL